MVVKFAKYQNQEDVEKILYGFLKRRGQHTVTTCDYTATYNFHNGFSNLEHC